MEVGFKPSAHYVSIASKRVGEAGVIVQDTYEFTGSEGVTISLPTNSKA